MMLFQIGNIIGAIGLLGALIIIILWFVINVLILTIVLKIALGIIDARHTDFNDVLVTAFIITIIAIVLFVNFLLLIIGALLIWYLISSRHDTTYCMAIIVSILALVVAVIVIVAIAIVVGALLAIPIILFS